MIRVLIISDIRVYRDALSRLLAADARFHVEAVYASIEEACAARTVEAGIVLLDVATPGAPDGIRCLARALTGARVVALGASKCDTEVVALAEAGVAGYVFRDASIDDLIASIQAAATGGLRCAPEIAAMLARRLARLGESRLTPRSTPLLTRREQQILVLIESGLSNKEIAARLVIEVATVKNHVHHLLEKLGARSRAEAACIGRRIGICTDVPTWTGSLDSLPPGTSTGDERAPRTWRDLVTSSEALPG